MTETVMSSRALPNYASRYSQIPFTKKATYTILSAGLIGEIAVEFIAWVVVPIFLHRPMEPSVLIQNLASAQLGLDLPMSIAFPLHFVAGAYIFVLFYMFFVDAFKIRNVTVAGIIWGLLLWVMAQGFFAPLADRPFFLGFQVYSWWSILLHVGMTVPTALALEFFGRKFENVS